MTNKDIKGQERADFLKTALLQSLNDTSEQSRVIYEEFLNAIRGEAKTFAFKRRQDLASSEDFCQEVLIAVHRARHTFDKNLEFYPWFYAIMKYKLADIKRREFKSISRYETDEQTNLVAQADFSIQNYTSDSMEQRVSLRSFLAKALNKLSHLERKVFKLSKMEDKDFKSVAEECGLTESNAKVISHRTDRKLKGIIGERG